jgi:hypothetical protein
MKKIIFLLLMLASCKTKHDPYYDVSCVVDGKKIDFVTSRINNSYMGCLQFENEETVKFICSGFCDITIITYEEWETRKGESRR